MGIESLVYKLEPWKDPDRNFFEIPQPLIYEEGAERAGIMQDTVCVPDKSTGDYKAYRQRGNSTGVWRAEARDCPRFNKCSECPLRQARATLRLFQELPLDNGS